MGADVREGTERSGGVAREQERLVDAAFQERERQHGAGRGDALRAIDELPAAREHAFANALEGRGVAIEVGGQRARAADVLIDHLGHFQATRTRP